MKKLKFCLFLLLFIPVGVLADRLKIYFNVTILEKDDLEVEECFNLDSYGGHNVESKKIMNLIFKM